MSKIDKLVSEIKALRLKNSTLSRQLSLAREKDRQLTRLTDRLYRQFDHAAYLSHGESNKAFCGVSFIVVAYNIPQQLQRTLKSLTPAFQSAASDQIEVIIIDNGSSPALVESDFKHFPMVSEIIRVDDRPSPVFGLNLGIAKARFDTVALMIDGAHIITPGIFNNTKKIMDSAPRPVINVPQYTLGPASQNLRSLENAYEVEEVALKDLGWPGNGYALFDYAVIPGESLNAHTLDAIESNCLITTKEVLQDCGAFDERFDEAGAGLANIEIFHRLSHDERNQFITFPGEGTFHQDHGGTTTSLASSQRDALVATFYDKYKEITGDIKNFSFRPTAVFGEVSICNRAVPTISTQYGEARSKILGQLAEIYVSRAEQGLEGPIPSLTFKPVPADERKVRPYLRPLGLQGSEIDGLGYRQVLKKIHQAVKPKAYFEIGVDDGGSLSLAECPSVGVDPDFELSHALRRPTRIFKQTSDNFFSNKALSDRIFEADFQLAFIDGMHLSEFVLRDFMNVESRVSKDCCIVIDDVLPEQLVMADRDRKFNAWCGDVYKLILVLVELRPDLNISVIPAMAGPYRKGVAVISNLDPTNDTLRVKYDTIESRLKGNEYTIDSIDELECRMPILSSEKFDELLISLKEKSAP